MNPDSPKTPREDLEIRLTALLLGELPEAEAAAWRAAIATNPELAKLHDRLKQTISLVHEATAKVTEPATEPTTPLKLSEERREKLLAHFKMVKPREFVLPKRSPARRLVELAAVVAILAVIGALLLPMGSILSRRSDESVALFGAAPESSDVMGYASRPLGSVGHSPLATNVIPSPAAGYTKAGAPLFDSGSPLPGSLVSSPSRTAGRANINFAYTPARKPDVAAQEAALPPQIVLPSTVESESLGVTEVAKVAETKEALHDEGTKGTTTWSADQEQRMFLERYGMPARTDKGISSVVTLPSEPGPADTRFQVSGRVEGFYSDLDRTSPATQPPAEAPVAVNGAEQLAFAGRGISPTTGLPMEGVSPDGATLGQTLTVTRADPAQTRSYGIEPASRESGAPFGGVGGGGGGAGERGFQLLGPEETPTQQPKPRQAAAGDFVAGYAVTPESDVGRRSPAIQAPPVPAIKVATTAPAAMEAPSQSSPNQPATTNVNTAQPHVVLGDMPAVGVLFANEGSGRFEKSPSAGKTVNTPELQPIGKEESLHRKSTIALPSMELAGETRGKAVEGGTKVDDGRVLVEVGKPAKTAGTPFGATWGDYNADGDTDLFLSARGKDKNAAIVGDEKAQRGARELSETRGRPEALKEQVAALEPQVEAAQKKVDELRDQLPISDTDAAGAARADRSREYFEAKKNLDDQLRFRGALNAKLAAEGIDLSLPKTSQVEIVDRAEPAKGKTGFWRSFGAPIGGTYASAARVRVERDNSEIGGFTTQGQFAAAYDPKFIQIESEVIQSADVLGKAVEKLNSNEAWAKTRGGKKEEAIALLKERLDLKAVPNTSLLEIRAKSDKPDEAAAIANAVAEAYTGYLQENTRRSTSSGIEALKEQSREVDKKVAQAQRELQRVARETNVQLGRKNEAMDLSRALSRYAELTGRTVLGASNLPPARTPLPGQSSVSKEEEIRALDATLAMNGISMVNVGDKFVKALPVSTANAAGAAMSSVGMPLIEADVAIRKPATNAPIPQPEIQASENAFSTFSLNVSDVSFKLAAASLEKGQMPDQASIRSEEFINAFDYHDPEPPPGMPVAFAWERSRYPFAHNRDLLRFSIKTGAVGRQAGRALNLTLLLDNSGSMERADRVHIIREALRVLAGQLQAQDKISVITFARTPRLVADGVTGDKAGEVTEQVGGLTPQGGTNLEEAMNLAYQTALRHYVAGGINRVVLLTDGAANLGNVEPESLKQKVETHRKQGIALDCFGIGWEGFNDDLLEVLSRNGDGRYGFINSPEEAATEFAGQLAGALQVAASDVKVQVEFNPARVTAYRQIGYAKHQLTKEQFRDNTVDAAEIAAQEAGNALYTVEVNPAGEGPLCIVRVRFKFPGTVVYREQEWVVPYTGSAVSLEQASPAMRLAASASAFSEWLVASPFAAEVTPDALLGYLSGVPEVYGADARPKKLEWMVRQAKSIEGK